VRCSQCHSMAIVLIDSDGGTALQGIPVQPWLSSWMDDVKIWDT